MGAAVHGEVAPGFEDVREAFARIAGSGSLGDGGAAYAAWHEGRPVVDLWTGWRAPGEAWGHDTRGVWASTAKAVTALCIQLAVDRGLLDVDAPVASYWPAFGQAGKEAVTLRHVLTHTAGVLGSAELTALFDHEAGTGFDRVQDILDAVARAAPRWEPGTRAGYHCYTYSWILGEVLRRVDGRTLGTFLHDEVAVPLGVPDVRIGTPVEEQDHVARIAQVPLPDDLPAEFLAYNALVSAAARDADTDAGVTFLADGGVCALDRVEAHFTRPEGLTVELGGSNMTGTARSVAKVFAALAEPDGIDGVRLASRASLATFAELQDSSLDACLLLPVQRALGYTRNIPLPGRPPVCGPNPETVLHAGMGGQIGFADPVARVGGAFTRNEFAVLSLEALHLNTALYGCLS